MKLKDTEMYLIKLCELLENLDKNVIYLVGIAELTYGGYRELEVTGMDDNEYQAYIAKIRKESNEKRI